MIFLTSCAYFENKHGEINRLKPQFSLVEDFNNGLWLEQNRENYYYKYIFIENCEAIFNMLYICISFISKSDILFKSLKDFMFKMRFGVVQKCVQCFCFRCTASKIHSQSCRHEPRRNLLARVNNPSVVLIDSFEF